MKVTVTSIFILILAVQLSSALDFSFNSPESAEINENFSVSIDATTSEDYDVKILVQNNDSGASISQIYNDGWKNPYYYLKSVFPDKKEFLNHVTNYSKNTQICVKLRKSATGSITTSCKAIKITGSESSNKDSAEEEIVSPEKEENETIKQSPKEDFMPSPDSKSETISLEKISTQQEKIVLSPKESRFVTKEEKILRYAAYSFTLLTVVIIIFLALRKI